MEAALLSLYSAGKAEVAASPTRGCRCAQWQQGPSSNSNRGWTVLAGIIDSRGRCHAARSAGAAGVGK